MKSYSLQLALLLAGVGVTNIVTIDTVSAQSITPANDGTNTNIQQNGNTFNIGGGQLSSDQQNLFQSFQKFGLNQNEIANFLSNPNIQNILGRVTGGDASIINGLIQVTSGNSNLFLMNPAGIVFGNNASLNIPASFTATTATGIGFGNNTWFNATGGNNYSTLVGTPTNFVFNTTQPGSIVNSGDLAVGSGANLTLLAGTTVNTGNLTAPGGNITVASVPGENVVRISQPGNVLSLDVVPPTANGTKLPFTPLSLPALLTGKTGVVNGLMVTADGKAVLTNSGKTVTDTAGSSTVAGNINVSGVTGGNVNVLGKNVGLFGANINASGTNGGGTVLIGGDYKGQGTVFNAQNTTIDQNSVINADAVTNGNGGKVIAWANGNTIFDGKITAKGGAFSGSGGFVETSGKNFLTIGNTATVNTFAPQGNIGTWLLDPTDLTVVASGGTGTVAGGNNSVADSTINNSTIVTALNGTNVNLTAGNSITVNAAIDASGNAGAGNLTLTTPTTNLNEAIKLKTGSTLSGTATTVNVGANGTVQNGVDVAAAGGKVNLAPATYTLSSTVNIGKDLTVTGAGANNTTVSGNNAVRVFYISDGNVTLDGLTITNGKTSGNGSGIYNGGTLTVNNSTLSANSAQNDGGGIYNGGTLTVNNSTLSANSAQNDGGGIYNGNYGTITVNNSTLSANSAQNDGGGIFKGNYGTITVNNSNLSGNSAQYGGGIFSNYYGTLTVNNSTLSGNSAQYGGGIFNYYGTLTVNNSTLSGNSAQLFGGGIFQYAGTSTVNNSTLSGNSAQSGGGIYNREGTSTVNNSTLSGNSAQNDGGGIYNIYNGGGTLTTVNNSTIAFNTADSDADGTGNGGGIFTASGTVSIKNSIIANNTDKSTTTIHPDVSGIFTDLGNNLVGKSDGSTGFTVSTLVGTIASPIDPLLAPLANNGGSTQTHALLPGSIAIEAGNSTNALEKDQRGLLRFGKTDIGAYEYQFKVINTNDSGLGSFRSALTNTNASANTETVIFRIPTTDPGYINTSYWSIAPTSALPNITKPVIIDGYSQTGATPNTSTTANNANLKIELNGANAGAVNGLTLATGSNGSTIKGLAINGFSRSGILAQSNDNNIQGNFIGTDITGAIAKANGFSGVTIANGATKNIIGTNSDGKNDIGEGNLISGNTQNGVLITGAGANANIVAGNKIGTNLAGTSALANGFSGVTLEKGASQNIIGTNSDGKNDANEGNLISGNTKNGVWIADTGTDTNIVAGNKIGTNAAGTSALANATGGVRIINGASKNIIGTNGDGKNDANEGNLISGNTLNGVEIIDSGTKANVVAGNKIGTNADGTSALANSLSGVTIGAGASNNIIGTNSDGTSDANEGNLISGNQNAGVFITDTGTKANSVAGNKIGTNLAGTSALANGKDGIIIQNGAANNIIGTNGDGTNDATEGNLISGNTKNGVLITGVGTTGNIVAGNKIGTQANGTSALANTQNGVLIDAGASNNIIGGKKVNTGNTIAFNAKGVVVQGNTSIGNQILGNSIFSNKGIGIDLNNDGLSVNGTNPSNLPNGGQNYPLLLSASGTTVEGILNSAPNTTYRLEFFSSPTSDQGKTFLGTKDVTTDAQGIAKFTATVTGISQGDKVTATATNAITGTSEFSPVTTTKNIEPDDFKYSLFFYPRYAHYFKSHHLHLNNSIFFRTVTFLTFNDVVLTRFNIFLPDIAAYMNSGGGSFIINLNDVMGADYEQLTSSTENQIVIRRYLISLISQSVGVEYVNLVNCDFKIVEGKQVAFIKIRKSPKPVKVKKDKKDKKEYIYVRKGDKTVLLEGNDAKKFRKDD